MLWITVIDLTQFSKKDFVFPATTEGTFYCCNGLSYICLIYYSTHCAYSLTLWFWLKTRQGTVAIMTNKLKVQHDTTHVFMPQLAAAVVWWGWPIRCVQEVPLSAPFVPCHAHLLSSKTQNDEQGSDKRELMSLLNLSMAAGALWGGFALLRMVCFKMGYSLFEKKRNVSWKWKTAWLLGVLFLEKCWIINLLWCHSNNSQFLCSFFS